MKRLITWWIFVAVACAALGVEPRELDKKLRLFAVKLQEMQSNPEKSVPPELLRKAEGIILLDRTKAGFLFAYQGGSGVAMVRDKSTRKWSAPAFLKANEASLGFQIGGQQAFIVILLMNSEVTRVLTDPTFEFGGEARGTAGDKSAGTQTSVTSQEQPVLVYTDRKGLYGGVAIKGCALTPDEDANLTYYSQPVSVRDVVFDRKVPPSEAASQLAAVVTECGQKQALK